jgi:hypothetical protein
VEVSGYGTLTVTVVDKWDDNLRHCQSVRKRGTLPLPDSERCVRKEGTLPLPNSERRVRKEVHKEQPTRKNNIRKTQQEEQQQQGAKCVVGKRDAVAVVEMLQSIGLGDGPALTRACNGEVSEDVARAWVDWVDHAPQSFKDPVAYMAKVLGNDPLALPPESRKRRGSFIETLHALQLARLIER